MKATIPIDSETDYIEKAIADKTINFPNLEIFTSATLENFRDTSEKVWKILLILFF